MREAKAELVARIDCRNRLGEGVLWNDETQEVMWTDLQQSRLHLASAPWATFRTVSAPERIGSFALVAGRNDVVLAAFESGFGFFNHETGAVDWIDRPALQPHCRFNDGRTDRAGRFWAGTMIENPATRANAHASLYRLNAHGVCETAIGGVQIANGLCWSPDGRVMYFADTPLRQIFAYDISGDQLGPRRVLHTCTRGWPDGSTVDAEGYLWNARWGGGCVMRHAPDGEVDAVLELPVPNVTCVAFGGRDLDHLFVTTAWDELTAEGRSAAPLSGDLFIYKTGYRGLPESRCTSPRPT